MIGAFDEQTLLFARANDFNAIAENALMPRQLKLIHLKRIFSVMNEQIFQAGLLSDESHWRAADCMLQFLEQDDPFRQAFGMGPYLPQEQRLKDRMESVQRRCTDLFEPLKMTYGA